MASTYFHGNSEIQGGGDGLQTLILMNPAYVGYSENQPTHAPVTNNFVFLNSNSSGNTHSHHPNAPSHQTQHFVGIPLHGAASGASDSPQNAHQQDVGFLPRVHYNLYNQQMDLAAARDATRSQQGLSLSLSSQQNTGYGSFKEREVPSQPLMTAARAREDDLRASGGSPSSASGGVNGVQSVLFSSKYLKAAQELLDEVAKVGNGSGKVQGKKIGDRSAPAPAQETLGGGDGHSGGEGSEKRGVELTTVERQEIQMKKAKLVNMLDEVEQRYRHYHHQMQIVISWFQQAAGTGSAKSYTALALQTISKQFRCLKDAILAQIKSASKSLGEEDSFGGKIEGSRLKYVDNQIRQQRALQQLGMIQHNAWRPQRGLPERSVSVLRAWLFEHFLHPYPKDSDKIMLAKQTGLTRSQVSNWFINARVRLWKPMVEEMYMEEIKEHETNESDDPKTSSKSEQNDDSASKPITPQSNTTPPIQNQNKNFPSRQDNNPINQNTSQFHLIGTSELGNITQGSPKKPRNVEMLQPSMAENEQIRDGFALMGGPTNFIGGFGSYPIGELGRFGDEQFQASYSGNGVSLMLGLPHCENLSISGAHQSFLPNQSIQQQLGRGVEIGEGSNLWINR